MNSETAAEVRSYHLKNGCRVLIRPTPDKQILTIMAGVRWGGRDDAREIAGRSNLMARLLAKDTKHRSAYEIADAMESVGGSINAFCSLDSLGMETLTVDADWRLAMEVLSECLFEPAFSRDEFEKEKLLVQAEIRREEDEKFAFAYKHFQRALYKGHPYEAEPEGEVDSVERLTREHLASLHEAVVQPSRMLLVVVGNVPDDDLISEMEKRWPGPSVSQGESESWVRRAATVNPGLANTATPIRLQKTVEQSFIIHGFVAPKLGTPESTALRLACGVLGEGMSARLFARLRDRDHLAYAVGSSLITRELASHLILYIGTNPVSMPQALEGMQREARGLVEEPITEAEVARAKRYIIGKYLLSRQTNAALANSMLAGEFSGLGWDWGEHVPQRIQAVTREEALAASEKYLVNPATVILEPAG